MSVDLFGSKKLEKIFEDVESLNKTISSLKKEVDSLKALVKEQNKTINSQKSLLLKNNEDYEKILNSVHEQESLLRKEIQEFKSLKININNDLLDNARLQIANSLKAIEEKLAIDTTKIDSLTDEFDSLKDYFSDLKKNFLLVSEIADKIKAVDLELKNYALVLEKNDKEKLRLMKRIDELETIIARMKRGSKRNDFRRR